MFFAHTPNTTTDRHELAEKFLRLAEVGMVPKFANKGHADGWGMAYYKDGNILGHYRSPVSAMKDGGRDALIEETKKNEADVYLMHLRKVTIGEPSERNSHPFVSGRFAFIHNGTLGGTAQQLFDPVRERSRGETDSELYFHLVIASLDVNDAHDPELVSREIARTVFALRVGTSYRGGGFTSASSILTDGRFAYVLREYDEDHPLVRQNGSEDYYTLYLGEGKGGARFVCSERLDIAGVSWHLLPNHSLTTLSVSNGAYGTKEI